MIITAGVLFFFFGFILEKTDLIEPVPRVYVKIAGGLLLLVFFWWPVDMLLHWEKRTPASMEKDKYICMVAITVILFVFPYHFLGTPLWPTLVGSLLIGIVFPGLFILFAISQEKSMQITPERVHQIALDSPKAKEFLQFFPDAQKYVIGLSQSDGLFAKLVLHHREFTNAVENGQIDYVLEVPVHRHQEFFIGGKEMLQCYLFFNDKDRARVGFLPSANMNRAYDYGFSEDELDHAIEEANESEQNWPPIGNEPILIQHFPGKVVPVY